MTHPMNTASVLLEDKQRFHDALHAAMLRIKNALYSYERAAKAH